MTHFEFQHFHFNGGHGLNGGGDGLTGRRGVDVYVQVPLGTVVTEKLSPMLLDALYAKEAEFSEPAEEANDFNFEDFTLPTIDLDKDKVYSCL